MSPLKLRIVSIKTVVSALDNAGLQTRVEQWLKRWEKHEEIDNELFDQLAQVLQADAVLIGFLDITEAGDYARSYLRATVGATITIIAMDNRITLYEVSDQQSQEGTWSEHSPNPSYSVHRPFPSKKVATDVLKALVSRIPARNQ